MLSVLLSAPARTPGPGTPARHPRRNGPDFASLGQVTWSYRLALLWDLSTTFLAQIVALASSTSDNPRRRADLSLTSASTTKSPSVLHPHAHLALSISPNGPFLLSHCHQLTNKNKVQTPPVVTHAPSLTPSFPPAQTIFHVYQQPSTCLPSPVSRVSHYGAKKQAQPLPVRERA